MAVLMDLEQPDKWPSELLRFFEHHHDLFLDWEVAPNQSDVQTSDRAIKKLIALLQPYAIQGWHCTRLTADEIATILSEGMGLPNAALLHHRIAAIVSAGGFSQEIADILKSRNQAHERNRAGRVCFCFFPPRLAGEFGIGRFFRHWGGEALYNWHENDPVTSPILRGIGTPCLIEASVPIASLQEHSFFPFKVVRQFLISRGCDAGEPADHEDCIKRPLSAEDIRRVIRFPDDDFISLTGCSEWNQLPVGSLTVP